MTAHHRASDSTPPPSTSVEVVESHLAVIRTHRPLSVEQWQTLRGLAHRLADEAYARQLDLAQSPISGRPPAELF